ncbi:MAG: ABC transporter permease [Nitriliruptor sp.]|uniref:ABC transporter permease n=1 Tax=Nitriliruptor sp. TaxID=2448056 RepID=UPI0034A00600
MSADAALEGPRGRATPRWRQTLSLLVTNRLAAAGLVVLVLVVVAAAVGPWIAPFGVNEQNLVERLSGPSTTHLFGTDELGRDVFSRVVYGARVSLQVGLVSVGLSLVAGTIIGLVAGYRGGWVDAVLMRLMDVIFSFPVILLAIAIVAVLQPSLFNVMLAIAVVFTPILARVVRGSVLSVREEVHIRAVRSLGASDLRIVLRHILPNVAAPIIVQTSLSLAFAILTEAALSYLGVGIQPPRAAWGADLQASQAFLASGAWWMAVFPGLAILVTVMAFNLLGDGLRDVLDPKQRSVIESRGVE